jgi:hypothetical protein
MNSIFWWGICLGGAVGFLASILANVSTPSFASYFARSRKGWIERSKKRALKQYNFIQRFRSGKEDRYMYFVAQWCYIILFSLLAINIVLVSLMHGQRNIGHSFIDDGFLFFSLLVIAYVLVTHNKLHLWYWRINNFEEYQTSLRKKWPDLDLRD